jgi:hypothetical protein
MKQNAGKGNRALLFGYIAVLLMVLFLAMRTEKTVAAVLCGPPPSQLEPGLDATGARILTEIESRYEQLAQALPALRDPFRDPVAEKAPPPPPKRPRPVTRDPQPVFPTVKSLLYDGIDPSVKLQIGDDSSGWLRVGRTFHGWTVQEISAGGVRVADRKGNLFQIRAK